MYERAIANMPPAPEKRYWQRYIYLWLKYALFEELDAGACRILGFEQAGGCGAGAVGQGRSVQSV